MKLNIYSKKIPKLKKFKKYKKSVDIYVCVLYNNSCVTDETEKTST